MNTSNPEIQIPATGRRHARYSDEFKRQVVAACLAPGVSKAAIALANGLNANMLRRWVRPHQTVWVYSKLNSSGENSLLKGKAIR